MTHTPDEIEKLVNDALTLAEAKPHKDKIRKAANDAGKTPGAYVRACMTNVATTNVVQMQPTASFVPTLDNFYKDLPATANFFIKVNWDWNDPAGLMQKDKEENLTFLRSYCIPGIVEVWEDQSIHQRRWFKMIVDAYGRAQARAATA